MSNGKEKLKEAQSLFQPNTSRIVFKADVKRGSALAGQRDFQAAEHWWLERKGGDPCTGWPQQGGTLQRPCCTWKYGFCDSKRVKGKDGIDTEEGLAVVGFGKAH